MFIILLTDSFQLWVPYKSDLHSSTAGTHNPFKPRKMTISSTFLIRLRFQGYHCDSGIIIFAREVTLNQACSPFKDTLNQAYSPFKYT